jgi:hypothetical protein
VIVATIIGTRKTELIIDDVNYTDEVSVCVLSSADTDSDFVSFAEALVGGGRDYTLKLTIRQDTDTAALWYYAWDAAGDDVTYEFWPNGGSPTPSATTPKFSGTLTISEPRGDFIGGEANVNARRVNKAEVEWMCTDKPTLTAA